MGIQNYLIEGVSCAGKTTVGNALHNRGFQVIHGDIELAYFGELETGVPITGDEGENPAWIWDVEKVKAIAADQSYPATFFCGGSRNSDKFIHLFDKIFVLEINLETLNNRLAARPQDEWGGTASEGEAFARFQQSTKKHLPKNGIFIDATNQLSIVLDDIMRNINDVPNT